jgi:hypothetical protein
MSETRTASWFQYTMLLGALLAGTITTQLVPAYQEHVGKVTYPSRAAASRSDSARETARGYSHSDHHEPTLNIVRSAS